MKVSLDFSNSDISLDNSGSLKPVSDLERVRQKILQRLRFFKRDWFLNINEGIPYKEEILTRPANAGLAASIFNKEILQEDGVTGIGKVSTKIIDRTLLYQATVQTIYGDIEVEI